MRSSNRLMLIALLLMAFSNLAWAEKEPGNPCSRKMGVGPSNPCAKSGSTFQVADPMGRNSMTFTSEAPLEDIVGTSSEVSGHIVFDPQNPQNGGQGELIVPVSSLNTGIPLRDEHLQGKDWLDADRYPEIVFTIESVKNIKEIKKTAEFQTYDVSVSGELAFHGHTKKIEVPGRLTYLQANEKTKQVMSGDLVAVRASFEVRLADFGITGPVGAGLVGSKVSEAITIAVSFRGSNADQRMAGNPCSGKAMNAGNPCGGKAMNPCHPDGK